MYAVKVRLADRPDTEDAETASTSSSYAGVLRGPRQSGSEILEAVDVWTGNPRVEHLVGQVQLYRCNEAGQPAASQELPVRALPCTARLHCGAVPQPSAEPAPPCRRSARPRCACSPCRWT